MHILSEKTMAAENWSWFPGNFLSVGGGALRGWVPATAEGGCARGWAQAGGLGYAWQGPQLSLPGPLGESEPEKVAEAHLGVSVSPPTACPLCGCGKSIYTGRGAP